MVTADAVRVVDGEMRDVPADGETMGEVVMQGNNVMKGYFADEEATAEAFRGGWFHSGDLGRDAPGRLHRDSRPGEGHHHLRRREHLHGRGREGARLAPGRARGRGRRHARREVGRAAESLRLAAAGRDADRARVDRLRPRDAAGLQGSERVEFGELPKTSTGKIKKYELRARERERRSAPAYSGRRSATLLGTACKTSAAAPSASRRSAAHGERGATL